MHYIYITSKAPNRLTDFIFCTKKQRLCMVYQSSQQKKKSPQFYFYLQIYSLNFCPELLKKINWKHKFIHLGRKLNLKICDKRPRVYLSHVPKLMSPR